MYLQRSLLHLLVASEDGSRLSRNPLQVLLCVGKIAIMYAKTVQREDCTSVCVCVCVFPAAQSSLTSTSARSKRRCSATACKGTFVKPAVGQRIKINIYCSVRRASYDSMLYQPSRLLQGNYNYIFLLGEVSSIEHALTH